MNSKSKKQTDERRAPILSSRLRLPLGAALRDAGVAPDPDAVGTLGHYCIGKVRLRDRVSAKIKLE